MAFVRVEQRNAHLAGNVRLDFVNGREGRLAKGTVTVISNHRRRGADETATGESRSSRDEESTAIQWTLWGKQAENAAEYLGKGSHVNIVGRLRNNDYEKEGEPVYGLSFTVEEIDYLDNKAESDARRARLNGGPDTPPPQSLQQPMAATKPIGRSRAAREPASTASA